jgi:hypothetical protein
MAPSLLRALPIAILLAGCSSSGEAAGPTTAPHAIDASIVSVRVGKANLGAAPGCDPTYRNATYDRPSQQMSWPACTASGSAASYAEVTRTLTSAEASQVEAVLAGITYQADPPCQGLYDGLEWFLETKNAANVTVEYSASNVNCTGYRLATDLPKLYELLAQLRDR